MGCGLNKLEKRDEKRPGNIYSTLKRPQVETKIDVSYEYRFLEFTTLSAAELPRSSAVRLTSLRDLPIQLLELYQQGFSLAALHPFVQPTGEQAKTPLEHIFRAILVKKTERAQKSDLHNDGYILELDCCSSLDHLTDQKIIPEFIKKIQEAASQGLKFVGVIPQFHSPGSSAGSSPLVPTADSTSDPRSGRNSLGRCGDRTSLEHESPRAADTRGTWAGTDRSPVPGLHSEGDGGEFLSQMSGPLDGPGGDPLEGHGEPLLGKMEIIALFNKPKSQQKCRQYYPVTIPLRVSKNGQTVNGLDANWLEHMSDHFRKGGVLVNAVFYLGMVNDSLHGLTDGVFIFEAVSTEESKTVQGYDAIVVEQWTVLEGVEVQTDYVPLLNSLAAYGWQLTCVLPTPVIKTTREGNISTKQIVFLQRPCLPQKLKKKESKFHWRFSREEMHTRQVRKSKGKLGARDKLRAEDSEKDAEDRFFKPADAGNCAPGRHQEHGGRGEGEDGPSQEMGVSAQEVKLCPAGGLSHGDVGGPVQNQNGPAAPGRVQVGSCTGPSDPGELDTVGSTQEGPGEAATPEDN
ncbi:raftlin [Echinops telfairi]|uniref:Raftlin n=1 Tax=Echinops telfairi TaxID=9371 RepID=A0AC55DPF1_ECHTE|nr:raftlin [Echinops telfairi]